MSALLVFLIAFVLGFVGSMPLAGPVSVMVVSRAGTGRFREAMSLALGASIAEAIYACLAFWGFATFLARHAAAIPVSRAITAVVLLAVGVHFVRWKPDTEGKTRSKPGSALLFGFTTSILNPTLMLTWSAVTTAIYAREIVKVEGLLALPFGIGAGLGVAGWNAVLVMLLRRHQSKLPKRFIAWAVRGMGVVLILLALYSAVDLVRTYLVH